jgi:hypothetical protein
MILTLRFARNGLLHPILQWFEGRDVALKQTVSKRDTAGLADDAEEAAS